MKDFDSGRAFPQTSPAKSTSPYRLCFRSLQRSGTVLEFPCDRQGQVDMNALDVAALDRYLFARAVIRGLYMPPVVEPRASPGPHRLPIKGLKELT